MADHSPTIIDLDIRIFKAGDGYTVTAQAPDSGLAEGELDASVLFDKGFQEQLTQIREEPFTTNEALFRQVGEALFRALFRGQIWDLFHSLWTQQVQKDETTSLRLRLHIDENAVEVATLPWEMMRWRDVFLGTQITTLLTRQLLNLEYGGVKSLRTEGAPRALLVIPGGSGLDVDAEASAITDSLKRADIPYDLLTEKVPLALLDDTLAEKSYVILHFIGHALFKQDASGAMRGSLRFNRPDENITPEEDEDWVTETDLQSLLGNHASLRLVVLNACHTAEISARPDESRGFWGVIPSVLRAGIPAVVAMQYAIRDDMAAIFAETFYKRLTSGKWAGHVDVAVTLARNACFLALPDDRGFATPALYLRSHDGVIFDARPSAPQEAQEKDDVSCKEAPQPPARLLHRYRNFDLEALIDRMPLLQRRLQRVIFQIDELLARNALDEKQTWRLHRYEKNRSQLEREMDELSDVLSWRLSEACRELRDLQERLTAREQEKEALEQANAYISYEMKNEIFELAERILKLQELLRAGEKTLSQD